MTMRSQIPHYPRDFLADWTYDLVSDFEREGVTASWRSGQPVVWGSESRKLEFNEVVSAASFSVGEELLAVATGKEVHIFGLNTLDLKQVLRGHTHKVRSVKFCPVSPDGDGYVLVSSSVSDNGLDSMIIIWMLDEQGKNRHEDEEPVNVEDLAVKATEAAMQELVRGQWWMRDETESDKLLEEVKEIVWRADARHAIRNNTVLCGDLVGGGSSPFIDDGRSLVYITEHLASSSGAATTSTIVIWDMEKREERLSLEGHMDRITWVGISPDKATMASASWDETLKLWDGSTGQLKVDIGPSGAQNSTAAFSPDSKTIAVVNGSPIMHIHNVADGSLISKIVVPLGIVRSLAWSPDGHSVAAGGSGIVYFWNPCTGVQEQKWQLHNKYGEWFRPFLETGAVQWLDSEGKMLAFKGSEGGVNVYDSVQNNKWRSDAKRGDMTIMADPDLLYYLRSARELVSVDSDQTVRFWSLN
ncbi:WD40-repeat-containing domain protein [Lipomyces orientalis]|uniref:WD40-repeat-containing domain protein n=1 Tax=Lipomyces orientalis TaxID=1233043 RepID=A0ACC3TCD0_9ASCO